jgi:hypothetical protein
VENFCFQPGGQGGLGPLGLRPFTDFLLAYREPGFLGYPEEESDYSGHGNCKLSLKRKITAKIHNFCKKSRARHGLSRGGSLRSPPQQPGRWGKPHNMETIGGSLRSPPQQPGRWGKPHNMETIGGSLRSPPQQPGRWGKPHNMETIGGSLRSPPQQPGRWGKPHTHTHNEGNGVRDASQKWPATRGMCNCGKGRRTAPAAPGGGAPRGCVGPSCGVRAVVTPAPAPLVRSAPVPRTALRTVVIPTVVAAAAETVEVPTVDTEIWGPHMWRFLHIAAEGCMPCHVRDGVWHTLLAAMRTGLPCPDCRAHYNAWLDAYPLQVTIQTGLAGPVRAWVLELHNAVNVRRGVPIWTAAEVTATFGPIGAGRKAAAREALAAAAAAGVGAGVIRAGEDIIRLGMW